VDREAELIRSSNWGELKRFYSDRLGSAWELAWVQLNQFQDHDGAVEAFRKSFEDPRFEEASYIMLWALGHKPDRPIALQSQSLRLYQAFQEGKIRPLSYWLKEHRDHQFFSESILERVLEVSSNSEVSEEDLKSMGSAIRQSAESFYLMGRLWETRSRKFDEAEIFYEKFFNELWVKKISIEASKHLFDREISDRLRFAYASKDGLLIKRLLTALEAKLDKLSFQNVRAYQKAFEQGLRWDLDHLTTNLRGAAFWRFSDFSPTAAYQMLPVLFAPEEKPMADFVVLWSRFFHDPRRQLPPVQLDQKSLAVWQIYVELCPEALSEALLKFPTEERFLFLWSLQNRQSLSGISGRPFLEKESETVRKNLERAFSRSTNKVLWFDRLRKCGCSQSFYEFALSEIEVPVAWVLEDLKNQMITNSVGVRNYIKSQIQIVGSTNSLSYQLSAADLQASLEYLTPIEKQESLLARFVLIPIPPELLNDDVLDLLWDAKGRVGAEVFGAWTRAVISFLKNYPVDQFSKRHWQWVEEAWVQAPETLEMFSPAVQSNRAEFPWGAYLEAALHHEKWNLLQISLIQHSDETLKTQWAERLLFQLEDKWIRRLIMSLKDPTAQSRLLMELSGENKNWRESFDHALGLMEEAAILNEQARAARWAIDHFHLLDEANRAAQWPQVLRCADCLEALGHLDFEMSMKVSELLAGEGRWEESWKCFVKAWRAAGESHKERSLETFLNLSIHARKIEDSQKILIDFLFQNPKASDLHAKILERLLSESSDFRLGHVRKEFVEKASKIDPLHPEILKRRAVYDYRATLIWNCFYSEDLANSILVDQKTKKRKFELWGITETLMKTASIDRFCRYLEFYEPTGSRGSASQELEAAERSLGRLRKSFKIKKKIALGFNEQDARPLRFFFEPARIEIERSFFDHLDEESWAAIGVGFLQMLFDRDRGLFDESALIERFFQGMLLSGSPLSCIVRLIVWLAIAESLIPPQVNQFRPQELVTKLPLLNQVLIFYLGEDFERKACENGLTLA
jgi:hypothetical protein